jgi:putative ABC transport system ATP-binding protein
LQEHSETTIVYFTYENIDLRFDHYLRLGYEQQVMVQDYDALCEMMGLEEHPMRTPLSIYGENGAELHRER